MTASFRVGIDIGGTFTDFVISQAGTGELYAFKLLSTPQDPAQVVLQGLKSFLNGRDVAHVNIVHGSTVATNALLERKGARTALVATEGFTDLLQIGRQNRPQLYDLLFDLPPQLIPEDLRFQLSERVDSVGRVLKPLDPGSLPQLQQDLLERQVESVAVCLLFSFLEPSHERQVAHALRQAGFFVSVSSEILPEFREVERASTTAVNAYVTPALDRYLARLETETPLLAPAVHLRIMQSNGGLIGVPAARQNGVRCILSGPAGGVVGARLIAEQGLRAMDLPLPAKIMTFDMGGTSTDVSLVDGEPRITTELSVSGFPIHIPVLDIHTIGAGGGSIARQDVGGALRVGPQSAGANPGPACYGRGGPAAVTDANLALGRILPHRFLGGGMPLQPEPSFSALARLGKSLHMDAIQAALGIVEIANAHMERALRLISLERGYDPQDFILVAFGGAGGLHAAQLAASLGIRRVLVSPYSAVLSALGMMTADAIKDHSQTVMLSGIPAFEQLEAAYEPIADHCLADLRAEGIPPHRIMLARSLDVRYQGQSYELNIPFVRDYASAFHAAHHNLYGYMQADAPLEVVTLRVRGIGQLEPPQLPRRARPASRHTTPLPNDECLVNFGSGDVRASVFVGDDLVPGDQIRGPALIVWNGTSLVVPDGFLCSVDVFGNIWMDNGYAKF